jgi:putative NADH-flavin reductase
MKILIFGASGATGRQLVEQAVAAGHEVSAFVRGTTAGADTGVRVHRGDVADASAVRGALVGQDAAISALGAPTPFRPYPAFLEGIHNIVTGMGAEGVRTLVYLSFLGVPESSAQLGFVGRHLLARRLLRHATEGHRRNEELIRASGLDWTIVRAPKLTNGPKTSTYRVGEHLEPKGILPTLSRADVAEVMLSQLAHGKHVHRCVTVMH